MKNLVRIFLAVSLLVASLLTTALVSADGEEPQCPPAGSDFGDSPDTYNTRFFPLGAWHTIGGLWLGAAIDAENDGVPSVNADGDDLAGTDDEDGVVMTPAVDWSVTNGGSVDVTVTGGSGCLAGWIDWGNDGGFNEDEDQILSNSAVVTGTQTITFTIPTGTMLADGKFYGRFRIYPRDFFCGCLSPRFPWGSVLNGEVEDYYWQNIPTAVFFSIFTAKSPVESGSLPWLGLTGLAVLGVGGVVLTRRRTK